MKHFTYMERKRIEELRIRKRSCREIGKALGRNQASVSREIRRNSNRFLYSADRAQLRYEKYLQGKKLKK
jgi:IS30 family transposase